MIKVETLRAALVPALPADRDAELPGLVAEIVAEWERETGSPWNYRDEYEEIILPRTERYNKVFLQLVPVDEVEKVEVRTRAGEDWDELVEGDDFELVGRRVLERIGQYWERQVRVTYSGGYKEAPADVQAAFIVQAKFKLARFSDGKVVVKSQNFEGGGGVLETADMAPLFKAAAKRLARKV